MKIILINDVKQIGHKGEIKNVSTGYVRNYLLPKKLAVIATDKLIADHELKIKNDQLNSEKIEKKHKLISESIKQMVLTLKSKANETGTLFSAITTKEIITKLNKELKSEFKGNDLIIKSPIKKIGEAIIGIKIGGFEHELKLNIKNDK